MARSASMMAIALAFALISSVSGESLWTRAVVSDLDIDLGVLDATDLDSSHVRASGYKLFNDVARNFQDEGGCVTECNDKADVADCVGLSRVKCVSIKTKGTSTVYFSMDSICIGKYSFEASSDYETMSVKCIGERNVKTIIAVADNDSEGGFVENEHPNITKGLSYGYNCGFHHQWSSEPVGKTEGKKEIAGCQGFEMLTMKFWGKDEDDLWTLKDFDATEGGQQVLTGKAGFPTVQSPEKVTMGMTNSAKLIQEQAHSESKSNDEPENDRECNGKPFGSVGVCDGKFTYNMTGSDFSVSGECDGKYFSGFHGSTCSGLETTTYEGEGNGETEDFKSSCHGKMVFGLLMGQEDGNGFFSACMGDSESTNIETPKESPALREAPVRKWRSVQY